MKKFDIPTDDLVALQDNLKSAAAKGDISLEQMHCSYCLSNDSLLHFCGIFHFLDLSHDELLNIISFQLFSKN